MYNPTITSSEVICDYNHSIKINERLIFIWEYRSKTLYELSWELKKLIINRSSFNHYDNSFRINSACSSTRITQMENKKWNSRIRKKSSTKLTLRFIWPNFVYVLLWDPYKYGRWTSWLWLMTHKYRWHARCSEW
jgi:hypothetical protein